MTDHSEYSSNLTGIRHVPLPLAVAIIEGESIALTQASAELRHGEVVLRFAGHHKSQPRGGEFHFTPDEAVALVEAISAVVMQPDTNAAQVRYQQAKDAYEGHLWGHGCGNLGLSECHDRKRLFDEFMLAEAAIR